MVIRSLESRGDPAVICRYRGDPVCYPLVNTRTGWIITVFDHDMVRKKKHAAKHKAKMAAKAASGRGDYVRQ